ncbi:MAG: sulfatase [Fidelibacterota bacterium]|nr:MAG: sulfatase [Candidatus Neomarinimicrobiota bacterium]
MGLGAAGLALPGLVGSRGQAEARPNIIFIMTDDHASHALSCYGSRINETPNLDRIAMEGMRFNNCFCTNSICAPSRAVILTGKYSHLNGVTDNKLEFDGTQQTFPKLLQQAGYETAMIGKWHLKSEPTGFDYWNVLPGQGLYHNPVMIEMGERKTYEGYVSDIITDHCLTWLKRREGDKPFCLMYHHKAPHRNWQPAERYMDLYEDDIPLPETFDDDYGTRSAAAREQEMTIERHLVPSDVKEEPPEGLSGRELKRWKYQRYMEDYLRCVQSVDDNVGRLLDYLDESGLAESTVVIYTSDQGFYLGDHGWFDKRFMYEESLRMPLLVRYPKKIKAGSVNDDMVLNLDFGPTFLDLADSAAPTDMQGRSFRRVLLGDTPKDWRTSMYYHYYEYPGWHMVKRHYGVRTRRYKLIHFYYDIDAWELYDLQEDPHELNNVYDDPAYTDVLQNLKVELERLQEQYGDSDDLAKNLLEEHLEGDMPPR